MDVCQSCQYYLECQNIEMPLEIISFIIDKIAQHADDVEIETAVAKEFGTRLKDYGTTVRMFRKQVRSYEDACRTHRDAGEE